MALKVGRSGTCFTSIAPAKVNLALHVTGRRPDGYHDIDTLAMFADVGDSIVAEPDDALSLEVSGQFAGDVPDNRENLVIAAAEALRGGSGIDGGARLLLVKNLPVGAGIGGGSSDAAATLAVLNRMWGTGLSQRDLMDLGDRLGADIPMCLEAAALRAEGKGDVLQALPGLPAVPLVIVWPSRFVSTGSVFRAVSSIENPPLPGLDTASVGTLSGLVEFLEATRNDLTDAACALEPAIGDALDTLRNRSDCLVSRMSGSGSACFGIFPTIAIAEAAASKISAQRPDWWVRAATAG